jgi:hypothetical protein
MQSRLHTDERHARMTVVASMAAALTTVALILLTLLVWYPRTTS